jgi:hypothetical protein
VTCLVLSFFLSFLPSVTSLAQKTCWALPSFSYPPSFKVWRAKRAPEIITVQMQLTRMLELCWLDYLLACFILSPNCYWCSWCDETPGSHTTFKVPRHGI